MQTLMRTILILGAACSVTLLSNSALAIPDFPGQLQEAVPGLSCPPPCTICHDTPSGGAGTATKPFGDAMLKYQAFAADGLAGAIQRLRDNPDPNYEFLERLERSADPNTEPGKPDVDICIRYGCGARVEPRGRVDSLAAVAALALAFALWLKRTRTS